MSTEAIAAPIAQGRASPRAGPLVARFLTAMLAGIAVASLVAVGGSLALGYRTFAVLSGSMAPAIHGGDAVVDESIPPGAARVGDVVTFKDPSRGGQLVTHRVRSVRRRGPTVALITKGDANNAVERWTSPADGRIGRVRYKLTGAGRAVALVRGRYGRLLLIALPALLLGLYELNRIWRPRHRS